MAAGPTRPPATSAVARHGGQVRSAHLAPTPSWRDLVVPREAELSSALRRFVATAVMREARAVRRDHQLRELLHTLLVKLDSDRTARMPGHELDPVGFRIHGSGTGAIHATATAIRRQFKDLFHRERTRVFHRDDVDRIELSDAMLYDMVEALAPWRILVDDIDLLAKAFQIFRTQAMKSGEGQFLTPQRIVRPCVMAMEIRSSDKVIDPACGSGGFLIEALRQVEEREFQGKDPWRLVKFANDNLYGIDKDPVGVKLTKAIMIAMQDGSTHTLIGDAIRRDLWRSQFPELEQNLGAPGEEGGIAEQFTVVLTNPPFGEDLKVRAADARAAGFTITHAAARAGRGNRDHVDLEIGLVYLDLAHRLLQVGGRIGIVLPETYFFSHKYRWLADWLEGRLALRGMLNIAMEAFEEFCRAKTNFYIFEKIGHGTGSGERTP